MAPAAKEYLIMNTAVAESSTGNHAVVSRERWLAARRTLLAREKDLTQYCSVT